MCEFGSGSSLGWTGFVHQESRTHECYTYDMAMLSCTESGDQTQTSTLELKKHWVTYIWCQSNFKNWCQCLSILIPFWISDIKNIVINNIKSLIPRSFPPTSLGSLIALCEYVCWAPRGAEGPGREILQRPPSVRLSVCPSVRHV